VILCEYLPNHTNINVEYPMGPRSSDGGHHGAQTTGDGAWTPPPPGYGPTSAEGGSLSKNLKRILIFLVY